MVDLVLRKRRGRAGEIGLFPESDVFEEEWSHIKLDTDVDVEATQRGTERHLKFSHVIARWVADCNGEVFTDAQDARDALLIECKHVVRKFDRLRQEAKLVPKPTRDLDLTAWSRLIKLMAYHAVATFNVPPEKFERETPQFMQQPEPPPHTEVPDGPMATQAAIGSRLHDNGEDDAAQHAEMAREERPAEPARRDMDEDEADTAAEPETAQAAAAANPEAPPEREPITWTVEMPGEYDWRIDKPGDKGTYAAYWRWHLDRYTDQAGFIVWHNSDAEWELRKTCGVGVVEKKRLEAMMINREWKT